jgi:hypothetical protein
MKEYHIISIDKRWALKLRGAKRAIKLFDDRQAAIDYAKGISHTDCIKICVHNKDATINEVIIISIFMKFIEGSMYIHQSFHFTWEMTDKTFIGSEFIGLDPKHAFDEPEALFDMMEDAENKDGFMPKLMADLKGLIGDNNYIFDSYGIGEDGFDLMFYIKEIIYKYKLKVINDWKKYNNFDRIMHFKEKKLNACPCHY